MVDDYKSIKIIDPQPEAFTAFSLLNAQGAHSGVWWPMDRGTILEHLLHQARGHVEKGERLISRQRKTLSELEQGATRQLTRGSFCGNSRICRRSRRRPRLA